MDKCCNHNALKLFSLCNQRSNLHQVYQKLKLISTVHKTQPTIQLLLRTSDFVGALDLITTTQEVLEQELQGVQALRYCICMYMHMAEVCKCHHVLGTV